MATDPKRNKYLLRTYGITEQDYDNLLAAHEGGCWVCGKPPKKRRLHVEHDHKTGAVRGLACWRCNALIERGRDDPAILRAAAEYLESDEASRILGKGNDGNTNT